MELWKAIVLGITQGLTEFLPVSSSGHLVIIQAFLKIPEKIVVSFDIIVHLGTLIAVIAYFYQDILHLIRGLINREQKSIKLAWYLIVGTIPAIIFAVIAKDFLEKLFGQASATGWQLIINGLILLIADRLSGNRHIEDLNSKDATWIGIGQAIAIIPGISRSGSTIAVGLGRKLSRQAAARFSFLLSIPVILGAGLLDFKRVLYGGYLQIGPLSFWVGLISAALSGYLVIKYFIAFLHKGTLKGFGYYCLVIGGIAVVMFLK